MAKEQTTMEKIVSLAKRRGFIFQSSEIYGGINSCYDYGPLGVELKRNIKEAWWRSMVTERDDIEGLDASILMHPRVWEASGHVGGFTDPMIDCRVTKNRYREDQLMVYVPKSGEGLMYAYKENEPGAIAKKLKKARANAADFETVQMPEIDVAEYGRIVGPDAKEPGTLTEPRQFNLMFKTFMGPVEEDAAVVYMRPETAQGIYVNYINVMNSARQKVPFGIAQIGKAFRNEITPGNFIFRTREFEQMEMQFFVKPEEDEQWFEHWKELRLQWHQSIGIRKSKLRFHEHDHGELAHYAKTAFDIEYEFPFGWQELEGIHNRTDFDLSRHAEYSKKDLSYFDQSENRRYTPYIVETSAGCDRTLLTCLVDAYEEQELEKDSRTVLHLSPKIAPIKAGIFPLLRKQGLPDVARKIQSDLSKKFQVFYDEGGAIGRRYRRMDEAGTPFGITVDHQTLEDQTVTLRERDSMEQTRVAADRLAGVLEEKMQHFERD